MVQFLKDKLTFLISKAQEIQGKVRLRHSGSILDRRHSREVKPTISAVVLLPHL